MEVLLLLHLRLQFPLLLQQPLLLLLQVVLPLLVLLQLHCCYSRVDMLLLVIMLRPLLDLLLLIRLLRHNLCGWRFRLL